MTDKPVAPLEEAPAIDVDYFASMLRLLAEHAHWPGEYAGILDPLDPEQKKNLERLASSLPGLIAAKAELAQLSEAENVRLSSRLAQLQEQVEQLPRVHEGHGTSDDHVFNYRHDGGLLERRAVLRLFSPL